MMTWQIMMGAELISMVVSIGVVIAFMLKKEPVDAVRKDKKMEYIEGAATAAV